MIDRSGKIGRPRLSTIGLVVLFLIMTTVIYWNSLLMPFERDEGEYAYNAWLLTQEISLYENSFLQKPPAITYVYWLGHKIAPFTVWPPRLLALLFTL
ncbi:MAG: hypothetical protein NUV82_03245, partial [Candidatus Komeilibacteria bacterium]|nr:hypothetical protein [Candidatus Komeilibacteria bacterium]